MLFVFALVVSALCFWWIYEMFVLYDIVVFFDFFINPLHDFIALGGWLTVDGCLGCFLILFH
jgi:hypothetical protein